MKSLLGEDVESGGAAAGGRGDGGAAAYRLRSAGRTGVGRLVEGVPAGTAAPRDVARAAVGMRRGHELGSPGSWWVRPGLTHHVPDHSGERLPVSGRPRRTRTVVLSLMGRLA